MIAADISTSTQDPRVSPLQRYIQTEETIDQIEAVLDRLKLITQIPGWYLRQAAQVCEQIDYVANELSRLEPAGWIDQVREELAALRALVALRSRVALEVPRQPVPPRAEGIGEVTVKVAAPAARPELPVLGVGSMIRLHTTGQPMIVTSVGWTAKSATIEVMLASSPLADMQEAAARVRAASVDGEGGAR